jgi:hypothetical protein
MVEEIITIHGAQRLVSWGWLRHFLQEKGRVPACYSDYSLRICKARERTATLMYQREKNILSNLMAIRPPSFQKGRW